MTDRITRAVATTIAELDWFKIPHTIDQVIGIYAEALGESRPLSRRTLTNEECLRAITARIGGRTGGHADPTAQSALAGEPDAIDDADGTLGAIDACLDQMHHAAQELADLVAHATGTATWRPATLGPERQDRIAVISSQLARLQPNLAAALEATDHHDHIELLARTTLCESATWLRTKAEEIWRASRGDHRPVANRAPGHKPDECRHCSRWRKGTIAQPKGLCQQCADFERNHGKGVLPIEAVVRRWEYGRGATPAQVLESKAAAKSKVRKGA